MEFQPRAHALSGPQLSELVGIAPDEEAMKLVSLLALSSDHRQAPGNHETDGNDQTRKAQAQVHATPLRSKLQRACDGPPLSCALPQGFRLQDPEVDDVVRAARELQVYTLQLDGALTAEENAEVALQSARLLQLGMEVQMNEQEVLVTENGELREELRVRGLGIRE
jgi:hypothetical protein